MVDAQHSHYEVEGERTAYEGKVAVDPKTGTILRLVLRANTGPSNPLMIAFGRPMEDDCA